MTTLLITTLLFMPQYYKKFVSEKLFGKKIIEEPKPKRKARKPRQKKAPVRRK